MLYTVRAHVVRFIGTVCVSDDIFFTYPSFSIFAAPEVLGPQMYDKSCDMWSLGVIMYIL